MISLCIAQSNITYTFWHVDWEVEVIFGFFHLYLTAGQGVDWLRIGYIQV
jgi:hypothetical protein